VEKHSIQSILEHYGATVHERDGWVKLRCPFHDDGHASATVNVEENAFNCFGCGVKGDTYSIIMEQERVGFREAVKIAEGITGKSSTTLRASGAKSRSISRNEGHNLARRGYSPPRVRRGASSRA
jgi:DNA primase